GVRKRTAQMRRMPFAIDGPPLPDVERGPRFALAKRMSSTTSADAPITDRAASPKKKGPGGMKRVLDAIERVGNKIPHPTVIFAALIVALVIFSHIFYAMGASVTYDAIDLETHALTESTASVKSL